MDVIEPLHDLPPVQSYGTYGQTAYSYDDQATYYDGSAPAPVYTYEALCTNFCSTCNRSFLSSHALLQHLRDHAAHKDGPEGFEAPPSDAYTGSDSGSGMQLEESMYAGWPQPPPPPGTPPTAARRASRSARKAAAKSQQGPKVPPPKPEEYDEAFPPLGPNASPAPVRRWIPASTGKALRAEAVEYTPCVKQDVTSAMEQPAVSVPDSPTKQLRVEAAAWAPTTPAA